MNTDTLNRPRRAAGAPPAPETTVWKLLLRRTDKVPPDLASTADGHAYQILEIVVARIASLLETGYRWNVSPISGDKGIDFAGRRTIFEFPDLGLNPTSVIYGQCKYKSRDASLIDDFGGALIRMTDLDGELPSLIIMVALGRFGRRQRQQAERKLRELFRCQILVLSKADIEHLIGHYFEHLQPLFDYCLPPAESDAVTAWFARHRPPGDHPRAEVIRPDSADTGSPFELTVRLSFDRPRLTPLVVRWIPPWEKLPGDKTETASQRLIAPAALATPGGLTLDAPRQRALDLRMTVLSYGSGRRAMGALAIAPPGGG